MGRTCGCGSPTHAIGWDGILDWMLSWFAPYYRQAEAFRRLRSRDEHGERRPDPTLVITGTGPGKTESFLYPVLDHAARARAEGHAGVKALLLHPMNALANDQADRVTPLNRKQRKQVWAVLESLMQTQAIDGQLFWPTMSAVGAEMLKVRVERGGKHVFDHVVVDEAQDFNAGHWRFLRACVASGPNDVFIAEDSHQRIYGNPLTLSHYGISTRGGASRRLTLNYRTTKENLDYALRILVGGDMDFLDGEGEVDSVGGYRSARTGPAPMIVTAKSEDEEFSVAAALINGWLEEAERAAAEGVNKEVRVGVMCRTRGQLSRVVSGLADHGIDAVQTKNAELASHEQVSVMTMHGAKGMEFTHVIVMGVGKEIMPLRFRLKNLSEEDARAALQRERSLLYVAASRARDALVVTTVGERSELLPEG